ncbi:DUF3046 domain-containing protein [Microbacterium caowuchunii]|uniref:DUF3046 domain-containing protein n=1 Tax=Microbacterium caowuchunii TaxID=2614638 RepID=UPI00124675FC|nr:DUF3046 domain-containing protein [Microbacterium caowuchunii]QEW00416.1 DUF3046 domain-containing protein [Microbacterium caowuchunii]
MRRSEFDRAVRDEFGAQGAYLVSDLHLSTMADRTASAALDAGEPARDVWLALCTEMDVPLARRHGVGRMEPRRS